MPPKSPRESAAASVHNDSRSETRIRLGPQAVEVQTKVQSLSLVEEMPELDLDGSGILNAAELEAGADAITAYLSGGMELGGPPRHSLRDVSVRLAEREFDGFGLPKYQWISVSWTDSPGQHSVPGAYSLNWFAASSPGHKDRLTYVYEDHGEQSLEYMVGLVPAPMPMGPTLWTEAGIAGAEAAWFAGGGLAIVLVWSSLYGRASRRTYVAAGSGLVLGAVASHFAAMEFWSGWWPCLCLYGWLDARFQKNLSPFWPAALWGGLAGWSITGPQFTMGPWPSSLQSALMCIALWFVVLKALGFAFDRMPRKVRLAIGGLIACAWFAVWIAGLWPPSQPPAPLGDAVGPMGLPY